MYENRDEDAQGRIHGRPLTLTPLEYRLLLAFVRDPNQVLSYLQLLDLAWRDSNGRGTRDQVKVYVGYLRRRLGPDAHRIQTARGFGYRYTPTPT